MLELEQESEALQKSIYEILWFMRGGVTREEGWALSHNERLTIEKIIQTNIKNSTETGMPLI